MNDELMDFNFRDRAEAGRQLAEKMEGAPPDAGTVVLALPRGGIPVGLAISERFQLPLEPLLVRKLGVPHFPEFAMGAIAAGGECVIDRELVRRLHLSDAAVDEVIRRERAELVDREWRYRSSVPLAALRGRSVIVVDDGMATGSTMLAAIAALRAVQAGAITVAVPVLARDALDKVERVAQAVIWIRCPEPFESVGQWYRDFRQLRDDDVIAQLSRAQRLPVMEVSAQASSSH